MGTGLLLCQGRSWSWLSCPSAMRIRAERARAESLVFHQGPMDVLDEVQRIKGPAATEKVGGLAYFWSLSCSKSASAATMPNGWKKKRDARSKKLHGS